MRSAPYPYLQCLPSRSLDQPSDGSTSPRAPVAQSPNDSLHPRSIPNLLRTHLSQQHSLTSHHSPLTPRLDMYPPRQIPTSLYPMFNDPPLSLAAQYGHGQAPWMSRGYDSRRQQHNPAHHTHYLRTTHDLDDYQRFKSIPRVLSADVERDRQARACGHPPPLSTSYGLRLDNHSQYGTLPFPYHHVSQGSRHLEEDQRQHDVKTSLKPAKLQAARPKPHVLYSRLDQLVRHDQHHAADHISPDDVIELYRQEVALQAKICEKRRGKTEKRDTKFRVIGAPLRDVLIHASSTVTIGEHQHDVPTVVVACIEELTRTGIYQPGLFRTLPSRNRYIQLIDIYNSSADYGAKFSMHKQTMPDICAVLSTFISGLPHPILDPRLYNGLWHWCVKPSVKREEVRRYQQDAEDEEDHARGELPHSLPTSAKQQRQSKSQGDIHLGNDGDLECHQIMIAEIILRFLPISQLSLLIYLCGFFTQLPLCPENGIQFEDVGRIYGPKILGGTAKESSQKMMVWLLSRWQRISEGLLTDACGMVPSSSPAQDELLDGDDVGGPSLPPKTSGSRRSRSSDSDRSSSPPSSSCDQAESSTGRYKKKRSIESMPGSDIEAPSRFCRPSRRHRLGRRNCVYDDYQRKTSMEDLPARLSSDPSSDSTFPEHSSRDTPDCPFLEDRVGITFLENELQHNQTFADDEAHLLSEKVEQLDGTLGERMWRDISAPESNGLVSAAS